MTDQRWLEKEQKPNCPAPWFLASFFINGTLQTMSILISGRSSFITPYFIYNPQVCRNSPGGRFGGSGIRIRIRIGGGRVTTTQPERRTARVGAAAISGPRVTASCIRTATHAAAWVAATGRRASFWPGPQPLCTAPGGRQTLDSFLPRTCATKH